MILPNQYQIKQQELNLLQTDGKSLAHYAMIQRESKYQNNFILIQQNGMEINWAKFVGKQVNSNIKSFILILLNRIYSKNAQHSLLILLKKKLYDFELDLSTIKGHELSGVSSNQMKKLLVQFFHLLDYSITDNKVDDKLYIYPVIMVILIIFIRKLLADLGFEKAQNYNSQLPTYQILMKLAGIFNLQCEPEQNCYKFGQNSMFIQESSSRQYYIGKYTNSQASKNNSYHSKSLIQQPKSNKQIAKCRNVKNKFGSHKSSKSLNTQQTQQSVINMRQKGFIQIGQHKCMQIQTKNKHKYDCFDKINKIKLQSNLYEINLRIVSKNNQPKHQLINRFDLYISSKGINCQLFSPNPNSSKEIRKNLWVNLKNRRKTEPDANAKQAQVKMDKRQETNKIFRPTSNLNEVKRRHNIVDKMSSIRNPK